MANIAEPHMMLNILLKVNIFNVHHQNAIKVLLLLAEISAVQSGCFQTVRTAI